MTALEYETKGKEAIERLYTLGNVKKIRARMEMLYGSNSLLTNVIRAMKRDELDF